MHPLDIIIDWLGKYPKARVADFGCGEARLAATVPNKVCRARGRGEGGLCGHRFLAAQVIDASSVLWMYLSVRSESFWVPSQMKPSY